MIMKKESSSSRPKDSMKALMEAVAQVSTHPFMRYTYSQPTVSNNAFVSPGMSGTIAPLPAKSAPINIIGGMPFADPGGHLRKRKQDGALAGESSAVATKKARTTIGNTIPLEENEDKRSKRLEQNRQAAVESRRRKKHMVEELQRSVQYYSRANATLKSQNAELERQLLVAKQRTMVREKPKSTDTGTGINTASAKVSTVHPQEKHVSPPKESMPEAETSEQSTIHHVSRPYSALIGAASRSDTERQAQQAQYAATQALYKSMGYPAGAARVAASTFSQLVGQTGTLPALSAAPDKASVGPATAAAAVPKVDPPPSNPADDASPPPRIEADDGAYVQALKKFAMQQVAAANAAAAAASAAIQAAHLHDQLKRNGGSRPAVRTLPSLSFSYPAGVPWPIDAPSYSLKD